jgi:hypothetical protein
MLPSDHINSGWYGPWMTEIPTLRCPSDPGVGLPASGRSNYAACLGDSTHRINGGNNNTNNANQAINNPQQARGYRWAHGRPTSTGFFTIYQPNSITCANGANANNTANWTGFYGASSRHQGGAN